MYIVPLTLLIITFYSLVTVKRILSTQVVPVTATTVTLLCYMRDYIRPDEEIQWFKENTQLSSALDERYSVVYVDGLLQAQNGMATLSPSRISALVISNLVASDAGNYTCTMNETSQFATVDLIIIDSGEYSSSYIIIVLELQYYYCATTWNSRRT